MTNVEFDHILINFGFGSKDEKKTGTHPKHRQTCFHGPHLL